ncbi:hypothetical protein MRX96_012009 [Rhipicephalus microplus]
MPAHVLSKRYTKQPHVHLGNQQPCRRGAFPGVDRSNGHNRNESMRKAKPTRRSATQSSGPTSSFILPATSTVAALPPPVRGHSFGSPYRSQWALCRQALYLCWEVTVKKLRLIQWSSIHRARLRARGKE